MTVSRSPLPGTPTSTARPRFWASTSRETRPTTAPSAGCPVRPGIGTRELTALVRDLDIASVEIVDLQLRRPSLDDVFLTLTGHQAEEVRDEEPSQDRRGRR